MTNTTAYLEQYLDSLETLPSELKKNFGRMNELDLKNKDIMVGIDSGSDEYLRKVRDLSPGKRKAEMEKIQVSFRHLRRIFLLYCNLNCIHTNCFFSLQKMFKRAKENSDNKVDIAVHTYELVDKHIRKLDSDLARFESEMKVTVQIMFMNHPLISMASLLSYSSFEP